MTPDSTANVLRVQHGLQLIASSLIALTAAALFLASAGAAAGLLPWLELPVRYGETEFAMAGQMIQIGATILALMLCGFLPSAFRVMRLEAGHRDFRVRMDDVTRAYWAAHAADRAGTFTLPREFDAVRERILFLRDHPDLGALDGELLELAAQMSHESRELAEMFSEDKVARARESLARREADAGALEGKIADARVLTGELRRWLDRVTIEEDVARSQIARLRQELSELLPQLDPPTGGSKGRLRIAAGQ